ncbi:MAG: PAS domain S-box protein [Pirellulales bacterium]|nr:PAS domain S-box protein [Pirellulales bacterium]
MQERQKILSVSIIIVTVVALLVGWITTWALYRAAFREKVDWLQMMVRGQARLIEAVAGSESTYRDGRPPQEVNRATLRRIVAGHEKFGEFGQTGEIVIGQREGDSIVFLCERRFPSDDAPMSIPIDAEWAEPMRRALSGRQGWTVAPDYRGETVLAAYEPIDALGVGLVAKCDLKEVRAPLVKAASLAAGTTVLLVLLGATSLLVTDPLARRLQESEQRFRSTFEQAAVGLAHVALDGRFIRINRKFCDIAGYPTEDLLTRTFQEITHPDDLEADLENVQQLLAGEIPNYSMEKRYLRSDGSAVWINLTASLIREPTGEPKYFIAVIQDITERKRIQGMIRHMVEGTAATTGKDYFHSMVQHLATALDVRCAVFGEVSGKPPRKLKTLSIFGESDPEADTEFDLTDTVWEKAVGRTTCLYEEGVGARFPEDPLLKKLGAESFLGMPLFDASGCPLGLLAVLDDGSLPTDLLPHARSLLKVFAARATAELQRVRAEEELVQLQALLQAAIEQSPSGILIADAPDVNIRVANAAALGIRGKTSQRLTGIPVELHVRSWRVFYPDGSPYAPEDLPLSQAILRGKTSKNVEVIIRHADGQDRWVLANAAPVRDGAGKIVAGVAVLSDITERKQAEQALRESLEASADIVRSIPSGLLIFQYERPDRLTLLETNPQAEKLTGVTAQECRGRQYDELWPQARPLGLTGSYLEVMRTGKPFQSDDFEYGDSRLVGTYRIRAFRMPGDRLGVAFEDITGMKQAERLREELIANLEAQNAELERFTYTVSHDLKSPLITLKGYLGLLEEDLQENDVQAIDDDLSRMSNAADKMARLLDELLELSRIGRLVNPPEDVSLADLAHEAVELVGGQIAKAGARVEIAPELPVVCGDRARLSEVLQNLVDNAAKYMGDQAEPRITIGARLEDGQTVCFVRDNGLGVDPCYQEKIFGLFDQLDPSAGGSGVGLALVKRIVEVHGGRIWVESAGAGQGSTFCFTLPSGEGSAVRVPPDAASCGETARI